MEYHFQNNKEYTFESPYNAKELGKLIVFFSPSPPNKHVNTPAQTGVYCLVVSQRGPPSAALHCNTCLTGMKNN